MKTCSKCKTDKPLTVEFFYFRKKRNIFESKCIECCKISNKNYYINNEARVREKVNEYRENNPEKRKNLKDKWNKSFNRIEYDKNRREEKREYLRKQKREYKNNRLLNDKAYLLRERISSTVRIYIKKNKGFKSCSVWNKLSYTPQQLRNHIETQFDSNMSWGNYGTYWQIDHIYPQSKLLYDSLEHPNFLKCWKLDNLRPLEKFANILKGDKIL